MPPMSMKVLLLTNNYVNNQMETAAKKIAKESKVTLTFDRKWVKQGRSFEEHEEDLSRISASGYQAVVLQEKTICSAFPKGQVL